MREYFFYEVKEVADYEFIEAGALMHIIYAELSLAMFIFCDILVIMIKTWSQLSLDAGKRNNNSYQSRSVLVADKQQIDLNNMNISDAYQRIILKAVFSIQICQSATQLNQTLTLSDYTDPFIKRLRL